MTTLNLNLGRTLEEALKVYAGDVIRKDETIQVVIKNEAGEAHAEVLDKVEPLAREQVLTDVSAHVGLCLLEEGLHSAQLRVTRGRSHNIFITASCHGGKWSLAIQAVGTDMVHHCIMPDPVKVEHFQTRLAELKAARQGGAKQLVAA